MLQVKPHSEFFQFIMHWLRQLGIVGWQDAVLRFDHADFGAELAIGDSQLQTDVTATDHDQPFRHGRRRQGFGGRDDRPTNRQHRQVHAV
ncbi:hypothetical protein D3C87_1705160 [compost metagenome]